MIGSFITRAFIMALGYIYPAFECFKTVESETPDAEQLTFWCQYWMIIAVVTVLERLADTFVSWLPLYSEAKLAFIIYLWYPKTKGTTYIYSAFFKPFVARHKPDIDRNLNELRDRAGDIALSYWQRGLLYAQTRFMELLQYIASQSNSSRPQSSSNARHFPQPGHQPPPHPSGYQSAPPPPSYQSQARPPQSGHQLQPPPASSQPPTASFQGLHTQPPHREEEDTDYELLDIVEPTAPVAQNTSEQFARAPQPGTYMTRSRQRKSRMQR